MPIGKDSIKTRVAKVTPAEEAPVEVAETKAPAKKPATPKAAATKKAAPKAEGTAPKAPAKKPAAPKVEAPVAETPAVTHVVDTAVLANVSPETVAAVIGHDEKKPSDKVKIGQKMPSYLL